MKRSGDGESDSVVVIDDEDVEPQNVVDLEDGGGGDGDSGECGILAMAAQNPDQWPHVILRGPAADLAALRHLETHSDFFVGPRAKLQEDNGGGIACRVKWQDGGESSAVGDVYITESQVLFVASGSSELETPPQEQDWAIGATCIHLHAMTEEPEESVYLQLTGDGASGDDESTLEVTLIPTDPLACQSLFDGLCKLVAKHPLQLDEDDDEDGEDYSGAFGGGGDFFGGGGGDRDDLIWVPAAAGDRFGATIPHDEDDDEEGGATEEERAAMLERLDNLLVVRPELETHDGQFDDADEAEDDDATSPQ